MTQGRCVLSGSQARTGGDADMERRCNEVSGSAGGRLGCVPLLRPIIWFRFLLGAAIILYAVLQLVYFWKETSGGGEMFQNLNAELRAGATMGCCLLGLIGYVSLAIADGLRRQRQRAAQGALVFDAILVTLTVIGLAYWSVDFFVAGGVLADGMRWGGASACLALVCAFEASCLLRGYCGWAHAWRLFGLVVAGLVFLTVIAPLGANRTLVHRVRPLLRFIDANWVRIPQGSRVSVISRSRNSSGACDYKVFVDTRSGEYYIYVQRRSDGRWYFPAGDAIDGWLRGDVRISTIPAARKLLRNAGVVDPRLGPGRVNRLYEAPPNTTEYAFWSPRARGVYTVQSHRTVGLYFHKPLVVPLQTGVRERSVR